MVIGERGFSRELGNCFFQTREEDNRGTRCETKVLLRDRLLLVL